MSTTQVEDKNLVAAASALSSPSSSPHMWISLLATVLVWLGYAPELLRLYRRRVAGSTGWMLWTIWIGSSGFQLLYLLLEMQSAPLILVNSATIFLLNLIVALWNGYYAFMTMEGNVGSKARSEARNEAGGVDTVVGSVLSSSSSCYDTAAEIQDDSEESTRRGRVFPKTSWV